MLKFAAIDFETADSGRDSACALAIVRVHGRRIVATSTRLIRPPRREIYFSYIHGITWADVADQPTFREHWPAIREELEDLDFLVAHNAPFDRSVLYGCCEMAGYDQPPHPFHCTVRVARRTWKLPSNSLPVVSAHLGIPLKHHDPTSDATACARILLAALEQGEALPAFLKERRR
ncbi:MAG: Exonuclease RNase T and DNA polymerase III [bacterium]|nr:MAG: Exonuclease RNase T and DNA polymerase III [bacterium]